MHGRLVRWILGRLHVPTHNSDGWIYCTHPKCKALANELRFSLGLLRLYED